MPDFETKLADLVDEFLINRSSKSGDRARAMIEEARDFKITFGSGAGRRTLESILKFCQFADPKFKARPDGTIDPYMTHVLAGMENVAIFILQRRSVDIPAYEERLKAKARLDPGEDEQD